VFGVLLIAVPDFSMKLLGILVGCMMIGFGAVKLMGYFSRDLYRLAFQFDLAYGILLIVLGLIVLLRPVQLVSFVIVGGYETFVSRLDLEGHPDQPEWLSHVNAGVLKIKLSTAIIGISSIHLLKSFINAGNLSEHTLMWQVIIHVVFLFSALAMALVDKTMTQTLALQHQKHH